MSKLNFKTVSTLVFSGFLSMQTLWASDSQMSDLKMQEGFAASPALSAQVPAMQEDYAIRLDVLRANVPPALHKAALSTCGRKPQWFITYLGAIFTCDTPILESLYYTMAPTANEVKNFYAFVKANPKIDLGFSDALTKSVRVFAAGYDSTAKYLNFLEKEIALLPHNLWAFDNIKGLSLSYNKIRCVRPLVQLPNLTELFLSDNQIRDVEPLGRLPYLTRLSLSDNKIVYVEPLEALTNLKELFLCNNQISYVGALGRLTNLEDLYLFQNPATETAENRQHVQSFFSPQVKLYPANNFESVRGTKVDGQ